MNRFFLIFLLFILISFLVAQDLTLDDFDLITESGFILRLNMNPEIIAENMGSPIEVERIHFDLYPDYFMDEYVYEGILFRDGMGLKKIGTIRIISDKFSTSRNITVGDPLNDVYEMYGYKPLRAVENSESKIITYEMPDPELFIYIYDIIFEILDNEVIEIQIRHHGDGV